jgi:hypothetical protein
MNEAVLCDEELIIEIKESFFSAFLECVVTVIFAFL